MQSRLIAQLICDIIASQWGTRLSWLPAGCILVDLKHNWILNLSSYCEFLYMLTATNL